jgi:hypothetical protein
LFAADVRSDTKGSIASLAKLTQIGNDCALRELIDLMDLPDRRYVDIGYRRIIAGEVAARSARYCAAHPAYDPGAATAVRLQQKEDWTRWFASKGSPPVPTTKAR